MKHNRHSTLREHLRRAAKARWSKRSPEERSAHGKKMVQAREAERAARRAQDAIDRPSTIPESEGREAAEAAP